MSTIQVANCWLAAARAEYAKPADWRAWADNVILASPNVPEWVINVSLARDADQLRRALANKLTSEWQVANATFDELEIGYIWLRHKRGDIGLGDCLRLIGDRADSGACRFSCESIYDLLNALEAGQPIAQVEAQAKEILAPLAEIAQRQWDEIARTVHV